MPERLNAMVRGQRFPVFSCTPVDFFPSPGKPRLPPLVPIKDTSRILTKGKHNSPRILVARSLSSRGETREKEKARGGEKRIRREKWERKREREKEQCKITNPERSGRSAKLVKYALIYQWHAYQLPLLPTAMTIKPNQLRRWWRTPWNRTVEREGVPDLPAGPRACYPRSAFISHKFDMICAEYDNGYQPCKIAESLLPRLFSFLLVYSNIQIHIFCSERWTAGDFDIKILCSRH